MNRFALVALAFTLAPALALARGEATARASNAYMPLPSFDQLDLNGDARLAPEEVTGTGIERRLRAMDRNRDGVIHKREYLAAMGIEGNGPSTFDLLDASRNGEISRDEASVLPALAQQFEQNDSNGNGALDQSEFSAFEAVRGMNGTDLPPLQRSREAQRR